MENKTHFYYRNKYHFNRYIEKNVKERNKILENAFLIKILIN